MKTIKMINVHKYYEYYILLYTHNVVSVCIEWLYYYIADFMERFYHQYGNIVLKTFYI